MTELNPAIVYAPFPSINGWICNSSRWGHGPYVFIGHDGTLTALGEGSLYYDKVNDRHAIFTEQKLLYESVPMVKEPFYKRTGSSKEWAISGRYVTAGYRYLRRRINRKPKTFQESMVPTDFISRVCEGKPCNHSVVVYDTNSARTAIIKTHATEPSSSLSKDGLVILAYGKNGFCVFDNPLV